MLKDSEDDTVSAVAPECWATHCMFDSYVKQKMFRVRVWWSKTQGGSLLKKICVAIGDENNPLWLHNKPL